LSEPKKKGKKKRIVIHAKADAVDLELIKEKGMA
jgi:hypothetical protein